MFDRTVDLNPVVFRLLDTDRPRGPPAPRHASASALSVIYITKSWSLFPRKQRAGAGSIILYQGLRNRVRSMPGD